MEFFIGSSLRHKVWEFDVNSIYMVKFGWLQVYLFSNY
jgi:hypothetical protein